MEFVGFLAANPKVGRANDFHLGKRNAAGQLGEVFAESTLNDQLLQFAELAFLLQTLAPGMHLPERFHVGHHPGIAVGGELFRFQQGSVDFAVFAHPGQQRFLGCHL